MVMTLLIILLLIVGLLAVPLELKFRLSRYEETEADIALRWLFGLVAVGLSNLQPADESGRAKQRKTRTRGASSKLNPSRLLRHKSFRDRLLRFLRELWHAIRREDFRLYLKLGVGDPADTGLLWSLIGPLSGVLFMAEDADITIEPDFIESSFEFEGSGTVRLIPLQLLYLVLGLLFSPAIWRGVNASRTRQPVAPISTA